MRIVAGFVTNSSSSSFVAWGVSADTFFSKFFETKNMKERLISYIEKKLDATPTDHEWIRKHLLEDLETLKSFETEDEVHDWMDEDKSEFFEFYGDFSYSYYCESLGIGPDTLETSNPELKFGEVRKYVAGKLNEFIGQDVFSESDVHYIEEAWHD